MKMHFSSESSYTELADKGYTSKMLAQHMVNDCMSASKRMSEKNCNSEEILSLKKI